MVLRWGLGGHLSPPAEGSDIGCRGVFLSASYLPFMRSELKLKLKKTSGQVASFALAFSA